MFDENSKKSKFKYSIGVTFFTIFLALIGIFIVYVYYRQSINPNPEIVEKEIKQTTEESSEDKIKTEAIISTYNEDGEAVLKVNSKSVFDTDLKITEDLKNAEEKSLPKNEVNLELTEEFMDESKNKIMRYMYVSDYNNAYNTSLEISNNYNFDNYRQFEVFIYEILQLKNYETITVKEKIDYLSSTYSPEIILFLYLSLDLDSKIEVTKNKQSQLLMSSAVQGVNLTYKTNLTAGLYSEMDINNAYFVVPDNIEGYKIKFELNEEDLVLYYIRYKDSGKLEIIYLENISNPITTIAEYLKMQ